MKSTPEADAGPPDGDPALSAAADATGLARWLHARDGASTTGDLSASRFGQLSWAMFQWARDPYVLVITIYMFQPYFANYVVGDHVRGLALAGTFQAASGIIIAILAPLLGAIADSGGRRKPWIALFTLLLAGAMVPMWFALPHAGASGIFFIGALIALANVSYEFTTVFFNALLPSIAQQRRVAGLSGLGYTLGNAAGIVLLLFMLIAMALPGLVTWSFIPAHPIWGISQALHEPERLAGPICAVWLILFCLPLFFFTPDRASTKLPWSQAIVTGLKSVVRTIKSLRHYRNVGAYLLARLFFNDGMTAVLTFGGIYASSTFGWGVMPMLVYGIELSVFAVLGGFLGGWLDNAFGSKRAIFISIGGTTIFGLLSLTMGPDRIFWFIPYDVHAPHVWAAPFFNTWPEIIFLMIVNFVAMLIVAGYANSRTMLARIAPPEKMTEFFGLYSLSGQSTSFLATGFVGWLVAVSHSQRIGLLGETLFLCIGLVLMFFVKEQRVAAV